MNERSQFDERLILNTSQDIFCKVNRSRLNFRSLSCVELLGNNFYIYP